MNASGKKSTTANKLRGCCGMKSANVRPDLDRNAGVTREKKASNGRI